jgi:hypothetical protein
VFTVWISQVEFAIPAWGRAPTAATLAVMASSEGTGALKRIVQAEALFTFHANPKYFLFHPSHRIFQRMHGALNVGKKDN